MKSSSFRLKRGELLLAKHFTFWIIVILLIWNKSLKIEVYFVRISIKKISVYSQGRFPRVRSFIFIYFLKFYLDTQRGKTEIYEVLEKIILTPSPIWYFFKDPHIFLYYPSKCLHNEFILPMILPVYQLRQT